MVSSSWVFILYIYVCVCVMLDGMLPFAELYVVPLLFKHSMMCTFTSIASINAPTIATSLFWWQPTIEKLLRLIWYKRKQMCCVYVLCVVVSFVLVQHSNEFMCRSIQNCYDFSFCFVRFGNEMLISLWFNAQKKMFNHDGVVFFLPFHFFPKKKNKFCTLRNVVQTLIAINLLLSYISLVFVLKSKPKRTMMVLLLLLLLLLPLLLLYFCWYYWIGKEHKITECDEKFGFHSMFVQKNPSTWNLLRKGLVRHSF